MSKNPYLNALTATLYITLVVTVMNFAGQNFPDKSFFAPVAFISLFSFSAAAMAYIFGYQPFMLYFDGHKKAAANLFLKTLAVFGAITFLILFLLFSGLLPNWKMSA